MRLNPMGTLSAVLAMVVLLVSPATFAADEFRLQVSKADSQSTSGEVLVSVRYQASTGVGAAQFEIVFDSQQLGFRDLVAGSDLKSALLEQKQQSPGRVRAAFVTSDAISGQGELLIVTFSPKASDWNPSSITIQRVCTPRTKNT